MNKKIVQCIVHPYLPPTVGKRAYVNTIDHPYIGHKQRDPNYVVMTSTVQSIREDGSFETENTVYVPVKEN